MTEVFSPELELKWRTWQARGVEANWRRNARMGALALAVGGALGIMLLFQVI